MMRNSQFKFILSIRVAHKVYILCMHAYNTHNEKGNESGTDAHGKDEILPNEFIL